MSQETSNPRIIPEPAEDFYTSQPWSLETYAEGLIEELFSEMDEIVDGSGKLPSKSAQPEFISLQPIAVPQIVLSSPLLPTQEVHQPSANQLSTVVVDTSSSLVSTTQQHRNHSFIKILVGVAGVSITIGTIWWLATHHLLSWHSLSQAPAPLAQSQTQAQAKVAFIDYMQQALEVIEQKNTDTGQKVATASSSPISATNPGLNGQSQTANRPGVVERYYIPIYQPPALPPYKYPNLSAVPTSPRIAAPNHSASFTARPATPVRPIPPQPVVVVPVPMSRPLPAPQAAPAPQPAPAPQSVPSVSTSMPIIANYTLNGVLESGDKSKSAALFESNGVTRRVQVGENIGSTGWTLADVANGEAVIRRNGEVRSVYVGQKF